VITTPITGPPRPTWSSTRARPRSGRARLDPNIDPTAAAAGPDDEGPSRRPGGPARRPRSAPRGGLPVVRTAHSIRRDGGRRIGSIARATCLYATKNVAAGEAARSRPTTTRCRRCGSPLMRRSHGSLYDVRTGRIREPSDVPAASPSASWTRSTRMPDPPSPRRAYAVADLPSRHCPRPARSARAPPLRRPHRPR
jgi:hypothetical protein